MERKFLWCTVVSLVALLSVTTEALRGVASQNDDQKSYGFTSRGTLKFSTRPIEDIETTLSPSNFQSKNFDISSQQRFSNSRKSNENDSDRINQEAWRQKFRSRDDSFASTKVEVKKVDDSLKRSLDISEVHPFTSTYNKKIDLDRKYFPRNDGKRKLEQDLERTKENVQRVRNSPRKSVDQKEEVRNRNSNFNGTAPLVFAEKMEVSRSKTGRKIHTTFNTKDLKINVPTSRRFADDVIRNKDHWTEFKSSDEKAELSEIRNPGRKLRENSVKQRNLETISSVDATTDSLKRDISFSGSESVRIDVPLAVGMTESSTSFTNVQAQPDVLSQSRSSNISRKAYVHKTETSENSKTKSRFGRSDLGLIKSNSNDSRSRKSNGDHSSQRRGSSKYSDTTTTENYDPYDRYLEGRATADKKHDSNNERSNSRNSGKELRSRSKSRSVDGKTITNGVAGQSDGRRRSPNDRDKMERRFRAKNVRMKQVDQDSRGKSRGRSRMDVTTRSGPDIATTIPIQTIASELVTSSFLELEAGVTTVKTTTTQSSRTSRPTKMSATLLTTTSTRRKSRGSPQRNKAKEDFFNHGLGFRGRKTSGSFPNSRRTTAASRTDAEHHGNPGWTLRRRPGHSNNTEGSTIGSSLGAIKDQTNEILSTDEKTGSGTVASLVNSQIGIEPSVITTNLTAGSRRGTKRPKTEDTKSPMEVTTKSTRRGNKTFEKNGSTGLGKIAEQESDNYPPEFKAKLSQLKNTSTKPTTTISVTRTITPEEPKWPTRKQNGRRVQVRSVSDLDTAASGNVFTTDLSLTTVQLNPLTSSSTTETPQGKRAAAALFAERSRLKLEMAKRLVKPELNVEDNNLDRVTATLKTPSFTKRSTDIPVAGESKKVIKVTKIPDAQSKRRIPKVKESQGESIKILDSSKTISRPNKEFEEQTKVTTSRPTTLKQRRVISERTVTSISVEEAPSPLTERNEFTTKAYSAIPIPMLKTRKENSSSIMVSTQIYSVDRESEKKAQNNVPTISEINLRNKSSENKIDSNIGASRKSQTSSFNPTKTLETNKEIKPSKRGNRTFSDDISSTITSDGTFGSSTDISLILNNKLNKTGSSNQNRLASVSKSQKSQSSRRVRVEKEARKSKPTSELRSTKKSRLPTETNSNSNFRSTYSKKSREKSNQSSDSLHFKTNTTKTVSANRFSKKKSETSKSPAPDHKMATVSLTSRYQQPKRREFRPRTATYRRHSEIPTSPIILSTEKQNGVAITPRSLNYTTSTQSFRPVSQEPLLSLTISNDTLSNTTGIVDINNGGTGNTNIFSPTRSADILTGNDTLLDQLRSTVAPLLNSLGNKTPVFSGAYRNDTTNSTAVRITPNGSPPRFSARYKGAELFVRRPSYQPTVPSVTTLSTPIENSGSSPPVDISSPGEPRFLTFYQAVESASIRNDAILTSQAQQLANLSQVESNVTNGTDNSNNNNTSPTVATASSQFPESTTNVSDITLSPRLSEENPKSVKDPIPMTTIGIVSESETLTTPPISNPTELPSMDATENSMNFSTLTMNSDLFLETTTKKDQIIEDISNMLVSTTENDVLNTEVPAGIITNSAESSTSASQTANNQITKTVSNPLESTTNNFNLNMDIQTTSFPELAGSTDQASNDRVMENTEEIPTSLESTTRKSIEASTTILASSIESIDQTRTDQIMEEISNSLEFTTENSVSTVTPILHDESTTQAESADGAQNQVSISSTNGQSVTTIIPEFSNDMNTTDGFFSDQNPVEQIRYTSTPVSNEAETTTSISSSLTDSTTELVENFDLPQNLEDNTIQQFDERFDNPTQRIESFRTTEAPVTGAVPDLDKISQITTDNPIVPTVRTRLIDFAQDILSRLQISVGTTLPSVTTTATPAKTNFASEISNEIFKIPSPASKESLGQRGPTLLLPNPTLDQITTQGFQESKETTTDQQTEVNSVEATTVRGNSTTSTDMVEISQDEQRPNSVDFSANPVELETTTAATILESYNRAPNDTLITELMTIAKTLFSEAMNENPMSFDAPVTLSTNLISMLESENTSNQPISLKSLTVSLETITEKATEQPQDSSEFVQDPNFLINSTDNRLDPNLESKNVRLGTTGPTVKVIQNEVKSPQIISSRLEPDINLESLKSTTLFPLSKNQITTVPISVTPSSESILDSKIISFQNTEEPAVSTVNFELTTEKSGQILNFQVKNGKQSSDEPVTQLITTTVNNQKQVGPNWVSISTETVIQSVLNVTDGNVDNIIGDQLNNSTVSTESDELITLTNDAMLEIMTQPNAQSVTETSNINITDSERPHITFSEKVNATDMADTSTNLFKETATASMGTISPEISTDQSNLETMTSFIDRNSDNLISSLINMADITNFTETPIATMNRISTELLTTRLSEQTGPPFTITTTDNSVITTNKYLTKPVTEITENDAEILVNELTTARENSESDVPTSTMKEQVTINLVPNFITKMSTSLINIDVATKKSNDIISTTTLTPIDDVENIGDIIIIPQFATSLVNTTTNLPVGTEINVSIKTLDDIVTTMDDVNPKDLTTASLETIQTTNVAVTDILTNQNLATETATSLYTTPNLRTPINTQESTTTPVETVQTINTVAIDVSTNQNNLAIETTTNANSKTTTSLGNETPTVIPHFQEATSTTAQGTAGYGTTQSDGEQMTEVMSSSTTEPTTVSSTSQPPTTSSSFVMTTTTTSMTRTTTAAVVPETTTMAIPEVMTMAVRIPEQTSETVPGSTTSITTTEMSQNEPKPTSGGSTESPTTVASEALNTVPVDDERTTIFQQVTSTTSGSSASIQMAPQAPQSTPYPGRFGVSRMTPAQRFSPISSTKAPLRDYVIYGIYPNKTIVRKRPEDNLIDARNVDSPYVIFGIYPDGKLVRKFPNGTIIPDPPSSPVEVVFSLSTSSTTNRPRTFYNQANQGTFNQNQAPVYFNNRRPVAELMRNGPTGPLDLGLSGNNVAPDGPSGPILGSVGTSSTNQMNVGSANTSNSNGGRIVQNRERDEATRTKQDGGQRSSVYIGQDKFVNYWNDGSPNPAVVSVKVNSVATAVNDGPASSPAVPLFENLLNNQGRMTAPPRFPWQDPLDQIFGITTSSPMVTASVASNSLDYLNEANPLRPINPFAEVFNPISSTSSPTQSSNINPSSSTTSPLPPTTITTTTPATATTTTPISPTTMTSLAPTTPTIPPTVTSAATMAPMEFTTTPIPFSPRIQSQTIPNAVTASTAVTVEPPATIPFNLQNSLPPNMQNENAFGTTFDDLAFLNSLLQQPNPITTTAKALTEVEQLLANKILALALSRSGPTRSPKAVNVASATLNSLVPDQSLQPSSAPIVIDLLPSSTLKPTFTTQEIIPKVVITENTSPKPTRSTLSLPSSTASIASALPEFSISTVTTKSPVVITAKAATSPKQKVTITPRPAPGLGASLLQALFGVNPFVPTTTQRTVRSTAKSTQTEPNTVPITQKPIMPTSSTESSSTTQALLNNPNPRLPNVVSSTFSSEDDTRFLAALLKAAQEQNVKPASAARPALSQDEESFLRELLSGQFRAPPTSSTPNSQLSDAALLAALLKAQGVEPSTPATNLKEQLQLASLQNSASSAAPTTSRPKVVTQRISTSRPRLQTTTWSPSSTYPPPLFSSFGFGQQNGERSQVANAARSISQFLGAAFSGLQSFVRNGTRTVVG